MVVLYKTSPTDEQTRTSLRAFLLAILPPGTEVFMAQNNRVPEPAGPNWVEMTPLFMNRLATNLYKAEDVAFTGSIAGTTLTVTSAPTGVIQPGQILFGTGVVTGTSILAQTGTPVTPGGIGTYTLSQAQTLASSLLASGTLTLVTAFMLTYQLDVHGPDAGDNVSAIAALVRDQVGVDLFAATGYGVVPIDADEPKQLVFVNSEQQYENRWSLDVRMQISLSQSVSQQYADQIDPTLYII